MKPPKITQNHPQPTITTHNHLQSPTTIHDQPQPPTTIHNHPKGTEKSQKLSQTVMLLHFRC